MTPSGVCNALRTQGRGRQGLGRLFTGRRGAEHGASGVGAFFTFVRRRVLSGLLVRALVVVRKVLVRG